MCKKWRTLTSHCSWATGSPMTCPLENQKMNCSFSYIHRTIWEETLFSFSLFPCLAFAERAICNSIKSQISTFKRDFNSQSLISKAAATNLFLIIASVPRETLTYKNYWYQPLILWLSVLDVNERSAVFSPSLFFLYTRTFWRFMMSPLTQVINTHHWDHRTH